MPAKVMLADVSRIPLPGDNVAIATQRLDAGTVIGDGSREFVLDFTIMEGHRFAIQPIHVGQSLLSWNLPFGEAILEIAPGAYVCNTGMLEALAGRSIDFALPPQANFQDKIETYTLNEAAFEPAQQVARFTEQRTFMGYRRPGGRGVGTRNTIVLLGTTSRTGGFVKQLEARLKDLPAQYANIDDIVAVAHTEGGSQAPNNLELLLRTLAGFVIHPNVGAVLLVDYGLEPVTNGMVRTYMQNHNYPLDAVPHHFLSLTGGFQANLAQGEAIVRGWLEEVNSTPRTPESVANLKIALQCGGSDAFSGVSGNPLAAWVAREVIRYGGAANLAETDELIGAEPYILDKVRNVETARKFLATIERFKERVAWHGHTAEGNPSGGNKFRGLYNIALKSIGAGMKKNPDVRLDAVIDYGELMHEPGYYFMDSPGNDLESVAGQVAAGCNVIFFVTGNGSITNFPFVPTLKFVTTSRRYRLLSREMDVNAGAYLDGVSMDDLGAQTFEQTLNCASGERSVGEKAGHAQTQIWRDWRQTSTEHLDELLHIPTPTGSPLPIHLADASPTSIQFSMIKTPRGLAADQVGLILPTSLCSGQIAAMTAHMLNQKKLGRDHGLSRFVTLTHTEGCGASSGASEALFTRTMLGYLAHPLVKHCLLLEHGCEKTHNDYMRHALQDIGLDPQQMGWASVQLDGGIEAVMQKIEGWFAQQLAQSAPPTRRMSGVGALRLGLMSAGLVSPSAAQALARLTQTVVAAGGSVVTPDNAAFLSAPAYRDALFGGQTFMPSLAYGEHMRQPGFHMMETPTSHWVETLSGIGATGVDLVAAYVGEHPIQTHPLTPVLQITADENVETHYGDDIDLVLTGAAQEWPDQILQLISDLISGQRAPKLMQQGNIDFQITRGLLGVSM
ncbi:MAG: UxaA family hydrolase [Caldilineaceae bacterium]